MLFASGISSLLLVILSAGNPVQTRLPDAAMQGDMDSVRSLLAQKIDVNEAQGDGMTALHGAAFRDDMEMLKVLLGAGANPKATTRVGAISPLFMACENGSPAAIEALLTVGAEANAADSTGTTALMKAALSGSADSVRVLL